jgi:hypothetical protein
MKKTAFALLGFLLVLVTNAQKVQFGVKAGVNLTDIRDDLAPNNTNRETGFHAGLLAHIHVSRHFAVQPELLFSSQGAKYTLPTYNGETKNTYIALPVMLQYMIKGLRIQTGPQLGYLLSSKFEPNGGGAETDLKSISNNLNLEWAVGAGYLTPVGLGIDARYNFGISNMYETGRAEARSRVWQIGLFYQFPKK